MAERATNGMLPGRNEPGNSPAEGPAPKNAFPPQAPSAQPRRQGAGHEDVRVVTEPRDVGEFAGRHVLAELHRIEPDLLDDPAFLHKTLDRALNEAGATVCEVVARRFEPQGVTVLALLAESHASVHTYPEVGATFVDVFTCGDRADPEKAVWLLAEALGTRSVRLSTIDRGPADRRRIVEPLGPGMNRTWEVSDVLFETATGFQDLLIGRTDQGISLFCDNERQSTEASQLVYHEALMVPGLLLADRIRRVLVIGSSEGVASQIAVAAGAEVVDHADIDRIAVESCARYLPYGYSTDELASAERGDGVVRMHYQDGFDFLAGAAERGEAYDLVVIDLPDENTDPDAQHNRLYAKDFLLRCGEVLAPGGVLAAQAGCPTLWRNATLGLAYRRFTESFPTVLYYGSDEHEWAFLFARKDSVPDPVRHVRDRLPGCAYRPSSVDDQALVAGTIPPHAVRATCREGSL